MSSSHREAARKTVLKLHELGLTACSTQYTRSYICISKHPYREHLPQHLGGLEPVGGGVHPGPVGGAGRAAKRGREAGRGEARRGKVMRVVSMPGEVRTDHRGERTRGMGRGNGRGGQGRGGECKDDHAKGQQGKASSMRGQKKQPRNRLQCFFERGI